MPEKWPADRITRRGLFCAAGLAGASVALPQRVAAEAAKPDPAITEVQDWQRQLGDGVDKRAYGTPSKFEQHVIRRHVPWLTAAPESAANFTPLHALEGIITPSGLCFERHHSGIAEIDPQKHRLMINGLVEKPLVLPWTTSGGCRA
jgi:sulfane dehydrogenase subunit SoxC